MNLTRKAQMALRDSMTLEDALPTKMPIYVNSMAYLFGVSALSALGMLGITGIVMAAFGPGWYHVSKLGHFVNSLHFWSVQVFFGAIVLHGLTKFFMAAWRDGRWKTWMIGVLAFGIIVFTGLTGFLSQTNWDSQWIAVQAKDAMNALGVGAFFNTMDTTQVLTLHVVVLPLFVVALVGVHLFLIRHDSPVRPLPGKEDGEK
ncbi:MAG: cytochrome b N-terminal domain-containing protein [Anaerolineae bacterium]|jgi:quinol-cytochrome oxidoreductase complex cytochrome b subunit